MNYEILDKYYNEIKKIYEYEKEHIEEYRQKEKEGRTLIGWEWYEVGIHPVKLNKLVTEGILKITFKSRKSTVYRLVDYDSIKEYIENRERFTESRKPEKTPINPDDLFKYIVGYDDIKKILKMILKSEKPVHCLLIGPPASGKTLFLEDIYNVYDDAEFVIGSEASGVGLNKLIRERKPSILLIDEIDKILRSDDLSTLLGIMESGKTRRVKGDEITDLEQIDIKVIAAGNRNNLPQELRSRFGFRFYLKPYEKEQFLEICKNYLTRFENVDEEMAEYIGERVWEDLDRDIRTVRSIARLSENNKEQVDFLIETMKKYRKF